MIQLILLVLISTLYFITHRFIFLITSFEFSSIPYLIALAVKEEEELIDDVLVNPPPSTLIAIDLCILYTRILVYSFNRRGLGDGRWPTLPLIKSLSILLFMIFIGTIPRLGTKGQL